MSLTRPLTRGISRSLSRGLVSDISSASANIGLLPFGGAGARQFWWDNDDDRDCYDGELVMAAAAMGNLILHGVSTTTSTSADSYNDHVSDAVADAFGTGRQAIRAAAVLSGLDASRIPVPSATFKGRLSQPVSGVIDDTAPLNMATATALVAAIHAHGTVSNPFVIGCGGTLTIIADAYLQDPTIADKVVVSFLGGTESTANGYNEWADGWATVIALTRLKIVFFPFIMNENDWSVTCPQVLKSRILSDMPVSYFQGSCYNKDHPSNALPGDHDADGACIAIVLDRVNCVTAVQRKSVSGLTTVSNGETHEVPAMSNDPEGNIWVVTGVNQTAMTTVWWAQFPLALWTGGAGLSFTPVAADDFNRADAATLGTGWAAIGSLTRNAIVSNQAGRATSGSACDKRTETYSPDQFAQLRLMTAPSAGNYPTLVVRMSNSGDNISGYAVVGDATTNTKLQRLNGASPTTTLLNGLPLHAAGDFWWIAIKGEVLTAWTTSADSGSPLYAGGIKLLAVIQDAIHASGVPGLSHYITGSWYGDTFAAGNVT